MSQNHLPPLTKMWLAMAMGKMQREVHCRKVGDNIRLKEVKSLSNLEGESAFAGWLYRMIFAMQEVQTYWKSLLAISLSLQGCCKS